MSVYKSGDVRVLGIMAEEESPLLPGIHTLRAQGYEVDGYTNRTLSFKDGVAPEVVAEVEAARASAAASPEVKEKRDRKEENTSENKAIRRTAEEVFDMKNTKDKIKK